jgi:arginyl-tRNA synthetase
LYHFLDARVREALAGFIRAKYGLDGVNVVTERPPRIAMGEVATPVCFELAKRLKRAPRQLAQEIVAEIGSVAGVQRFEVAGGGYVNAYLDRAAFFNALTQPAAQKERPAAPGKTIVEHTAINPNKAAHIGHLRNAVLGDTFVRLLRAAGRRVEVQNYIDNTGVQVADVVIGFFHLEKKSLDQVRALAAQPAGGPRFDFYCWDLYARVTQWLEEDPSRAALRLATLKAIEHGSGLEAEMGEAIATAIMRCHLRTMERLGIEYDALPRESEILHLKFWDTAFEQLKSRGAIHLATSGKNAGCWVMRTDAAGEATLPGASDAATDASSADDEAKIIVRSNGTVTYVGKDIAYQLWKVGLLGKEFQWRKFHQHPSGHDVWVSCAAGGDAGAPHFGAGEPVYTVIDSRQSYLQNVVAAGLRALGYAAQAEHSVHFAYEMVALTPRCAAELGYEIAPDEAKKPWVEVSGRKGQGVKADDLLDRLEAAAQAEVDARHAGTPQSERRAIAHAIAIGALRFYLLKYTRNTVVAFDFKDALSFEGETGPYCQYAVVRARNIFRKYAEQELARAPQGQPPVMAAMGATLPPLPADAASAILASPAGDDLWEVLLLAGSLETELHKALGAQEPAFVAKYAFALAQAFNLFYHKHHILSEEDAARQALLLALAAAVERQLTAALALLGIESPDKM